MVKQMKIAQLLTACPAHTNIRLRDYLNLTYVVKLKTCINNGFMALNEIKIMVTYTFKLLLSTIKSHRVNTATVDAPK